MYEIYMELKKHFERMHNEAIKLEIKLIKEFKTHESVSDKRDILYALEQNCDIIDDAMYKVVEYNKMLEGLKTNE